MNKKLQVFISSTYTDMLAERQAAVEAVLQAGHIPAGMELFASGDESQLDTIQRWIDDSDVFMLILGGRYGSVEQATGKSYIQLEYEYATQQRKPLFAAVISDDFLDSKIQKDRAAAIETVYGLQLRTFREHVTSKICRFFGDLNGLKVIVFESLAMFARNEELVGWVRGTDVIDPKAILAQVERLQSENATLRNQVTDLNSFIEKSKTSSQNSESSISDDAQDMLVTAVDSGGYILYSPFMGGASITVGSRDFVAGINPREEARWKAVIDELQQHGLVEDVSHKGETFKVTYSGYQRADKILAAANALLDEPSEHEDQNN